MSCSPQMISVGVSTGATSRAARTSRRATRCAASCNLSPALSPLSHAGRETMTARRNGPRMSTARSLARSQARLNPLWLRLAGPYTVFFLARDKRLMASFAQSRVGGGGAKTISACILTGVVRVLDFALLIVAALLAAIGVGAWLETPLRGLFSIRPIEVKRFQAICDCDVCCHSRILSSLRDRLFGSPIMGSGR